MLVGHMIQIHTVAAAGGSLQLQVLSDCNCYQQLLQQVGYMSHNSAGHSFAERANTVAIRQNKPQLSII